MKKATKDLLRDQEHRMLKSQQHGTYVRSKVNDLIRALRARKADHLGITITVEWTVEGITGTLKVGP